MTVSSTAIELDIRSIGGLGDGCAELNGHAVFVPFTCAGERVCVNAPIQLREGMHLELLGVIQASPARQAPACTHYGICGGCQLQHLAPDAYRAFKQENIARIVSRLGGEASALEPVHLVGAGRRRRVEWKIATHKGDIRIGHFAAGSHQLIPVEECPVSHADIMQLLPPLRAFLPQLRKPAFITALHITRLESGLDLLLSVRQALPVTDREMLAGFAQSHGAVRLCEQPGNEPPRLLMQSGIATARFGSIHVEIPAGAFLQATQEAQDFMMQFILDALPEPSRIADLFSGCGSYALPLAQAGHRVHAFEGGDEMVHSIHNAARKHALEDRLDASMRDLFRDPVPASELSAFDAAIINPPRNGALPQARAIAASQLRRVVMVSCNPATFERDAKVLLQHGFRITRMVPVDQFVWSAHLELIALFER